MYADLHMHSSFSDGTETPEEIVRIAKKNNISVIALADHDTVEGLDELNKEASKQNIETIPAVEISTTIDGLRIHVLGYYIDCSNKKLENYLTAMAYDRTSKTKQMLQKLNKLQMLDYTWDRVECHYKNKTCIYSIHVFEAMRLDGYYHSKLQWKDFYQRYFSKHSPVYMNLEGYTAEGAVEIILEAGGIPVLAHPKLIGDDRHIQRLIDHGLKGIEVYYPAHNNEDIVRYTAIAKEHKLLITGGTDWHGENSEWNAEMGEYGVGKFEIEALKNYINTKPKSNL